MSCKSKFIVGGDIPNRHRVFEMHTPDPAFGIS